MAIRVRFTPSRLSQSVLAAPARSQDRSDHLLRGNLFAATAMPKATELAGREKRRRLRHRSLDWRSSGRRRRGLSGRKSIPSPCCSRGPCLYPHSGQASLMLYLPSGSRQYVRRSFHRPSASGLILSRCRAERSAFSEMPASAASRLISRLKTRAPFLRRLRRNVTAFSLFAPTLTVRASPAPSIRPKLSPPRCFRLPGVGSGTSLRAGEISDERAGFEPVSKTGFPLKRGAKFALETAQIRLFATRFCHNCQGRDRGLIDFVYAACTAKHCPQSRDSVNPTSKHTFKAGLSANSFATASYSHPLVCLQ